MYKHWKSQDEKMLEEIHAKREIMMNCANISGFSSEETIQFSQELDKLIYIYQCTHYHYRSYKEIRLVFKQMFMILPKVLVKVCQRN